jgi:hypothetical protein
VPESFNSAIELHDSTVDSVFQIDQTIRVALCPAYVHKTSGIPGIDPGSGYVQDFILEFTSAQVEASSDVFPAGILDGRIRTSSDVFRNMIPLPWDIEGPISFTVFLSPDNRRLSVSGMGMKAIPTGQAIYVEDFKP